MSGKAYRYIHYRTQTASRIPAEFMVGIETNFKNIIMSVAFYVVSNPTKLVPVEVNIILCSKTKK